MPTYDILIKNGEVLDGISNDPRQADVGISGGKIKDIGLLPDATAATVIEASGQYISPGFVDVQNHSDSYLTLLEIPLQQSLVSQGITTIAVGHCGTSLAPISGADSLKSIQKWHSLAGANLNWLTFSEYLLALERYPLGVNVASLVGHATLRRGLIRDQVRTATPEETNIISRMIDESLDSGAAGLSMGLVYAHEVDATRGELLAGAKVVAGHDKLLSVHLRSEGSHITQALDEVLGLAKDSRVRLKISHLKIRDAANFSSLEAVLDLIDRAYQQGVDLFFDVYPYATSWNVLYTYLPKWAYEGGKDAILKNLRDATARERILSYLKSQETNLGNLFVASSQTNPHLAGKNLAQYAANQEVGVEEALLNVLEATRAQVVVFDYNLSQNSIEILLKHPLSVVATDGAGYDYYFTSAYGLVHPRCFGTMPKFLSMVREKKLMSWPEAIKKITSRPAAKLKLRDRGQLARGMAADVVVFDPQSIGSRASYENPYQDPDGIDCVIVNGKIAYDPNTERYLPAGKVLRI